LEDETKSDLSKPYNIYLAFSVSIILLCIILRLCFTTVFFIVVEVVLFALNVYIVF